MTREEYIDFANALKNNYTIDFNKLPEFCDMAISALSTEGDLISRQAVEDVIYDYSRSCDVNYAQIMEYIDKIPSVDDVICDLVSYKQYDLTYYKDIRNKRDRFYMKASSIDVNKEYIMSESEEPDGKKA